jgi:Trypsin-like peptidase domain
MRTLFSSCGISLLLSLSLLTQAQERIGDISNPPIKAQGYSVDQFSAVSSGACASAVHIGSSVYLTSLHFVDSVCRGEQCHKMKILNASSTVNDTLSREVVPLLRLPAYDLAFVHSNRGSAPPPLKELVDTNIQMPRQGQKIYVRSYPSCQEMKESQGIVEAEGILSFVTSAQGAKGSSGGGIFTGDGQLVGIVTESVSFASALAGSVFGTSFSLRGAPLADIIKSLTSSQYTLPQEAVIALQESRLSDWYLSEVLSLRGYARYFQGSRFIDRTQRLFSERDTTSSLSVFTHAKPEWSFHLSSTPSSSSALLAILSNGERLGPSLLESTTGYASIRKFLDPEGTARSEGALAQLRYRGYVGSSVMSLSISISILIGVTILATLWAFTLGLTWGWCNAHHFLYKVWMTGVVALGFWPLSFFIFLLKYKPKRKEI